MKKEKKKRMGYCKKTVCYYLLHNSLFVCYQKFRITTSPQTQLNTYASSCLFAYWNFIGATGYPFLHGIIVIPIKSTTMFVICIRFSFTCWLVQTIRIVSFPTTSTIIHKNVTIFFPRSYKNVNIYHHHRGLFNFTYHPKFNLIVVA